MAFGRAVVGAAVVLLLLNVIGASRAAPSVMSPPQLNFPPSPRRSLRLCPWTPLTAVIPFPLGTSKLLMLGCSCPKAEYAAAHAANLLIPTRAPELTPGSPQDGSVLVHGRRILQAGL